jgi:hypothetical protein
MRTSEENLFNNWYQNPPPEGTLLWFIWQKMVQKRDKLIMDNFQDYGDYMLTDNRYGQKGKM